MTHKQEIVKRLLENKQITFEESLVLLEVKEYVYVPYESSPKYDYLKPPFIVTCKQTH
jgi:hypothetical protein